MDGTTAKTGVEHEILKVYTLEEKLKHRWCSKQGGLGVYSPRKVSNLQSLKCYFLHFCKAFSGNKHKENASGVGRGTFLFLTTLFKVS